MSHRAGSAVFPAQLLELAVAGAIAGLAAGALMLTLAGGASAHHASPGERDPATLIEATHLPPLLTVPGEPLSLRYDVYCAPPGPDPESGAPCDAGGTVYIRPGDRGPFRPVELQLDNGADQGRYRTPVPDDIAAWAEGFSYYAVLRSNTTGASTNLPAGGASAPMRSRPLARPSLVALGNHRFGSHRRASERVAEAPWGGGTGQAGLEPGPELQPVGASSFAVDASGRVDLLDEANRRLLRFTPGVKPPVAVPVEVRGTIADLAIDDEGRRMVLETVGDAGDTPVVRSFGADGKALAAWHLAERGAGAIRVGPAGASALEYPAGQWMPVADRGAALPAAEQRRRAREGRSTSGDVDLVVQREGGEARIAEIRGNRVLRSWRITSGTSLGEIQMVEPFRNGVLVVLRVYDDAADEFEALLLDTKGVVKQFSLPSAAWAETAPLGRFRLQGSSLYELGSTPAGAFVDRYDLEQS